MEGELAHCRVETCLLSVLSHFTVRALLWIMDRLWRVSVNRACGGRLNHACQDDSFIGGGLLIIAIYSLSTVGH